MSQFSRKISQGGQGFGKFSRTINVQIFCTFEKLFSLKILVILTIKLYLLKPFPSLSIQGTIHNLNHTNLGLFRAPFPDLTSPLVRVWFSLYLLEQVMLVYIQVQICTYANKMSGPRHGQISIRTKMSGHSQDQLPNYNRPLLLIERIVNILAFLTSAPHVCVYQ